MYLWLVSNTHTPTPQQSPDDMPKITAGVLIGGASRRMGTPKHLIQHEGRTWLEWVVDAIAPHTQDIVLLGQGDLPTPLNNLEHLLDPPQVRGPCAGLLAAMQRHPSKAILLVACDTPDINTHHLLTLLQARAPDIQALAHRFGSDIQPIPALFEPTALPTLISRIQRKQFSLKGLLDQLHTHLLDHPGRIPTGLRGYNRPQDIKERT